MRPPVAKEGTRSHAGDGGDDSTRRVNAPNAVAARIGDIQVVAGVESQPVRLIELGQVLGLAVAEEPGRARAADRIERHLGQHGTSPLNEEQPYNRRDPPISSSTHMSSTRMGCFSHWMRDGMHASTSR